jgi:hypothetical protein
LVDQYAVAGRTTTVGFTGWGKNAGAGGAAGMAGKTAAAAMGGAGVAGRPTNAAGSGGATSSMAGAAAAGSMAEEDPLGDLFNMGMGMAAAPAISCEGQVCLEFADCENLHPDEHAACKFTRCEDLECK